MSRSRRWRSRLRSGTRSGLVGRRRPRCAPRRPSGRSRRTSRIAREMHDIVAHRFVADAVQAEAAPHQLAGLPLEESASAAHATFGTLRQLAGEGLAGCAACWACCATRTPRCPTSPLSGWPTCPS
ncbi:MAG: histidine kinase dimerization/phosphoacceptor domain-containing protein [Pseudonocardiaceae bacterium]